MENRKVLYADEGKVFTNGETYGKVIYLANGVSDDAFYQITDAEYERILKEQEDSKNEFF
jgi:hypothetical protein